MESTSYVLSFRMVFFLPCDHGLDFFTSAYYVRIQSINQSLCRTEGLFFAERFSSFQTRFFYPLFLQNPFMMKQESNTQLFPFSFTLYSSFEYRFNTYCSGVSGKNISDTALVHPTVQKKVPPFSGKTDSISRPDLRDILPV